MKFPESPVFEYDNSDFYLDEKFGILGIGKSSRKFVRDCYIFKNGIIEDVPIGKIYGLTTGYQYKNDAARYYLSACAAFENFYKWGFLSANFELGSFFKNSKTEQTAYSFQANNFTNLLTIGRW